MSLIPLIIIISAACAPALGKSIFDDDSPPEKSPPVSHHVPDPVAPAPERPANPIPPAEVVAPASPAIHAPIDYAQAMQATADRAIAVDPECVKRIESTIKAKATWDAAKNGTDADAKMNAFAAYNDALAAEKAARDAALARSDEYKEAKRLAAIAGNHPVAVAFDGSRPQEILDAIARRNLIEGMTLREVKQVARVPSVLVSDVAGRKTYRWLIKGRTGTYTVAHTIRFGHVSYETQSTWGTVAYVDGVFVDDRLETFQRVKVGGEAKGVARRKSDVGN